MDAEDQFAFFQVIWIDRSNATAEFLDCSFVGIQSHLVFISIRSVADETLIGKNR